MPMPSDMGAGAAIMGNDEGSDQFDVDGDGSLGNRTATRNSRHVN
jgi:hypothetical protein